MHFSSLTCVLRAKTSYSPSFDHSKCICLTVQIMNFHLKCVLSHSSLISHLQPSLQRPPSTFFPPRWVDCIWNVMAHAQKPYFVFRRNGPVHLNRRGRQFSRLLAAEVCASAVVMLDTPCSEVVWRVLAIHSTHQFPVHFPSHVSPCAITFQLDSGPTNCRFVYSNLYLLKALYANYFPGT